MMEIFMLPGMFVLEAIAAASPNMQFDPNTDALLAGFISFILWIMAWKTLMQAMERSKNSGGSGREKNHTAEAKISRLATLSGVIAAVIAAPFAIQYVGPIAAAFGRTLASNTGIGLLTPVITWGGIGLIIFYTHSWVSTWDHGRRMRKHIKKGMG